MAVLQISHLPYQAGTPAIGEHVTSSFQDIINWSTNIGADNLGTFTSTLYWDISTAVGAISIQTLGSSTDNIIDVSHYGSLGLGNSILSLKDNTNSTVDSVIFSITKGATSNSTLMRVVSFGDNIFNLLPNNLTLNFPTSDQNQTLFYIKSGTTDLVKISKSESTFYNAVTIPNTTYLTGYNTSTGKALQLWGTSSTAAFLTNGGGYGRTVGIYQLLRLHASSENTSTNDVNLYASNGHLYIRSHNNSVYTDAIARSIYLSKRDGTGELSHLYRTGAAGEGRLAFDGMHFLQTPSVIARFAGGIFLYRPVNHSITIINNCNISSVVYLGANGNARKFRVYLASYFSNYNTAFVVANAVDMNHSDVGFVAMGAPAQAASYVDIYAWPNWAWANDSYVYISFIAIQHRTWDY